VGVGSTVEAELVRVEAVSALHGDPSRKADACSCHSPSACPETPSRSQTKHVEIGEFVVRRQQRRCLRLTLIGRFRQGSCRIVPRRRPVDRPACVGEFPGVEYAVAQVPVVEIAITHCPPRAEHPSTSRGPGLVKSRELNSLSDTRFASLKTTLRCRFLLLASESTPNREGRELARLGSCVG